MARAVTDHGEDAMAALARILGARSDDQETTAVREWVGRMVDRLPDPPGADTGAAGALEALSAWLDEPVPMKR